MYMYNTIFEHSVRTIGAVLHVNNDVVVVVCPANLNYHRQRRDAVCFLFWLHGYAPRIRLHSEGTLTSDFCPCFVPAETESRV